MHCCTRILTLVGLLAGCFFPSFRLYAAGAVDECFVCGLPMVQVIYEFQDEVTLKTVRVCGACEKIYDRCFLCGVPVLTNSPTRALLNDGRVVCPRDSKTGVFSETDGTRIIRETRDRLDHMFSRFMSFPDTNVTVGVMDRVHLQALYRIVGNDFKCPDTWGLTQTETNHGHFEFQINIVSGLPLSWFQATVAHEYTHAWVREHVSAARLETLGGDAHEGLCELMGYLLMDAQGDADHKARMLRNGYTRGQIDVFIATEKQFGLNDILDWIQYGTDRLLSADDLGRVRKVELPRRAQPAPTFVPNYPVPVVVRAPDALTLKAVFWDEKRPLALINDQTLGVNEAGRVHVGTSNVTVRCMAIRKDSVHIQVVGTGEEKDLVLRTK